MQNSGKLPQTPLECSTAADIQSTGKRKVWECPRKLADFFQPADSSPARNGAASGKSPSSSTSTYPQKNWHHNAQQGSHSFSYSCFQDTETPFTSPQKFRLRHTPPHSDADEHSMQCSHWMIPGNVWFLLKMFLPQGNPSLTPLSKTCLCFWEVLCIVIWSHL